MKITERGPNTVTLSFDAAELFAIVNALEAAGQTLDPDDVVAHKRVQRPLVEALQYLRPKAHLSEGRWTTDWARGEDGKHV